MAKKEQPPEKSKAPPIKKSDAIAIQPPEHSMTITPKRVEIQVSPELSYKIIRVINQYINHLIKYHEDADWDVSESALWNLKWKLSI